MDLSEILNQDQPLVDEGADGGNEAPDTGSGLEGLPDSGGEPPAGSDEPPVGRNQKVPLAALHEERTRRQQHEADLTAERQRSAQLQERFNKFLMDQQAAQQQQQQAPASEAPPAFEEDPVAAFNYVQKQLMETQQRMQQYLEQQNGQQQQMQQHQQLAQSVSAQEAEYTKTVPDYPTAADYFYQRKVAEYTAFLGDPVAAQAQVARDYQGVALRAQQQQKNPAALMYEMAKAMGYAPGAPKPGAGRKEPPTSLSTLGGTPRAPDEKGAVTAADISEMSEAEFDKFWKEMSRGGRNVGPKV